MIDLIKKAREFSGLITKKIDADRIEREARMRVEELERLFHDLEKEMLQCVGKNVPVKIVDCGDECVVIDSARGVYVVQKEREK